MLGSADVDGSVVAGGAVLADGSVVSGGSADALGPAPPAGSAEAGGLVESLGAGDEVGVAVGDGEVPGSGRLGVGLGAGVGRGCGAGTGPGVGSLGRGEVTGGSARRSGVRSAGMRVGRRPCRSTGGAGAVDGTAVEVAAGAPVGGGGMTTGPTEGVGMNSVPLSGRAVLPTVAEPVLIAARTGNEAVPASSATVSR
ncbi:hypothetical protein AB0M35_06960 [Micromonospora sp. NPDC051196]|uniref:hypothetical protein n=1 Tax=Micromonospora sp. NPDC051196 TaxID=3155281 RepID=UPI0034445BBA